MKWLMCSFAMSFSILASGVKAEPILTVDGKDYPLSIFIANCQSMSDEPEAQIACFGVVSKLLEELSVEEQEVVSVPEALDALRTVAQYKDDDTGLLITGTECNIEIFYYNNYFHISRRNVSSIDLFSAEFDASKFQHDKITEVQDEQAPLSRGQMDVGATAAMLGGVALESSRYNFAPKSARTTIGDYASEVADQLEVNEEQEFDFVMVHPKKGRSSVEIWNAFEVFVDACRR